MSTRPLSPHLQVYRLPFTALLSISHRVTGVILTCGMILVAAFLAAAAYGPDLYAVAQQLLTSLPGQIVLWGWIYALVFHACHGVRHLIWDSGQGLDKSQLTRHNLLELAASILLTGALLAMARCPLLAGLELP